MTIGEIRKVKLALCIYSIKALDKQIEEEYNNNGYSMML
jgi:hypothetical protein